VDCASPFLKVLVAKQAVTNMCSNDIFVSDLLLARPFCNDCLKTCGLVFKKLEHLVFELCELHFSA
jgi:hypothetical protein